MEKGPREATRPAVHEVSEGVRVKEKQRGHSLKEERRKGGRKKGRREGGRGHMVRTGQGTQGTCKSPQGQSWNHLSIMKQLSRTTPKV